MDLSFTLNPREDGWAPKWAASWADIKASAENRRRISADILAKSPLEDEGADEIDMIHVLAHAMASESAGNEGVAALGGSFNPQVARRLMVGGNKVKMAFTFAI